VIAAFEFPPVSHLFEWPEILFEDTPFAINKTVLVLALGSVLLVGFFVYATRRRALVPTGSQNFAESVYDLVEKNVSIEVLGPEEGKRWTPFLAALFFFILVLNLIGLVPFIQFPVMSRIALPLVLAIIVYGIWLVVGFKHQHAGFIKSSLFPPGVPKALYILVTPIELVSTFIMRPFSHTVRLFANLMAGHILLTTFALLSAALWLAKWNVIFLPLPVFGGIAMTGFEVLVAVLQAYIFTILAAVYIGLSMHAEH
jgi:F-type H+-transporting ATPase subunit a